MRNGANKNKAKMQVVASDAMMLCYSKSTLSHHSEDKCHRISKDRTLLATIHNIAYPDNAASRQQSAASLFVTYKQAGKAIGVGVETLVVMGGEGLGNFFGGHGGLISFCFLRGKGKGSRARQARELGAKLC